MHHQIDRQINHNGLLVVQMVQFRFEVEVAVAIVAQCDHNQLVHVICKETWIPVTIDRRRHHHHQVTTII